MKFKGIAYVAGPYSAKNNRTVYQNIANARRIAAWLWEWGWVAVCPHLNSAHLEEITNLSSDDYLGGYLMLVEKCDIVILTENWEESEGAKKEAEFAARMGIPRLVWGKNIKAALSQFRP